MTLPRYNQPAVLYRMFDKDQLLLYIGISKSVQARLAAHGKDKDWFTDVCAVFLEHFPRRSAAAAAEQAAIRKERPRYNIAHNQSPDIKPRPLYRQYPAEFEDVPESDCRVCHRIVRGFDFRDEKSFKEYFISELCQQCQDAFFPPAELEKNYKAKIAELEREIRRNAMDYKSLEKKYKSLKKRHRMLSGLIAMEAASKLRAVGR